MTRSRLAAQLVHRRAGRLCSRLCGARTARVWQTAGAGETAVADTIAAGSPCPAGSATRLPRHASRCRRRGRRRIRRSGWAAASLPCTGRRRSQSWPSWAAACPLPAGVPGLAIIATADPYVGTDDMCRRSTELCSARVHVLEDLWALVDGAGPGARRRDAWALLDGRPGPLRRRTERESAPRLPWRTPRQAGRRDLAAGRRAVRRATGRCRAELRSQPPTSRCTGGGRTWREGRS